MFTRCFEGLVLAVDDVVQSIDRAVDLSRTVSVANNDATLVTKSLEAGRRKKEEGRRKKEEGRRKKEERRRRRSRTSSWYCFRSSSFLASRSSQPLATAAL